MSLTRRRLLAVAAAVPAVLLADRAMQTAGDAVEAAIRAARPAPDGTSATRCAVCGATDHAMLDPRCPAAPKVF